jgi:DNA-binding transcriptional LysR family regulator
LGASRPSTLAGRPQLPQFPRPEFAHLENMTCYAAAKGPHNRCNEPEPKLLPVCFAGFLSDRNLAKDDGGLARRRQPTDGPRDIRMCGPSPKSHTALMLVQAGAGIAFVPGALADVSIAGCVPPVCAARGRIIIHAAWPDGTTTGAGGAIPACRARRNARWLTRHARRRRGEHHT